MRNIHNFRGLPGAAFLSVILALPGLLLTAPLAPVPVARAAEAAQQQTFANPDEAVAALVQALRADDTQALHAIFGSDGEKLVESGDPVADKAARERFVAEYTAAHALLAQTDARQILNIGANAWPLPIPLVKENDRWRFDTVAGAQEIIDRRIGRNELKTIQTLLAVVAAEQDYFDRVQRGTGTGAYAARLLSQTDQQDGLYWDTQNDEPPSPLGPLVAQAQDEGYPAAESDAGKQIPYHGYYFHILNGQGPNAPGGARSYLKNGSMTGGFAVMAWPAEYENSGIMTFMVDQDGVVFQKDLGPDTAKLASTMRLFDPDVSWARVDITD